MRLLMPLHGHPHGPVPASARPSLTESDRVSEQRKSSPPVANIKSQIKRIKTNEKARQRNKAVKSELKTYVRRVREAIASGDKEAAEKAYTVAARKLDKAHSKGVIHKNQAANRKSKLARQINAL